ncbi:MAG TPA: hypothetical protein VHX15_12095 [Frankiaceae bacterium]|nr:hypothetical protein [Frankiaceae bacterium]
MTDRVADVVLGYEIRCGRFIVNGDGKDAGVDRLQLIACPLEARSWALQ